MSVSYGENVYYSPETHGLRLLGTVDLSEPDYSFDYLAVWKGEDGFYLGTDSGCSCPSPFENYNGKEDLTGPLTAIHAVEEAANLYRPDYSGEYYDREAFDILMYTIIKTGD